jgi:leucyl aminopeptidase
MDTSVVSGDITKQRSGAVIVGLFDGAEGTGGAFEAVDRALDGALTVLIEDGEIEGKKGEFTLVHTLGRIAPARVLVAGLGKEDTFDAERVRTVSARALRYLRGKGVADVATVLIGAGAGGLDAGVSAQALVEGAVLGLYRFDKYKSDTSKNNDIETLTVVAQDASSLGEVNEGVELGQTLAGAVNLCRDVSNEPANFMTPTQLSEVALDVARDGGLELQVLERGEMSDLGMGAILGVASGSAQPPKLIVLSYRGDKADESNNLALVGKGITFDSGGISIKSAANMGAMKGDMAGGGAVIAAMGIIAKLAPKINVTAIVPATENMPGGRAQRPGDIVTTMSGKTIEIDNTDAEGRLVLADAVTYARSLGFGRIVDVATLTGAISTALGKICSGVFGSDQALVDRVVEAGADSGERFWQLPMYDEYRDQYKSDVADIKNTGGAQAGSITGAQIIGEFSDGAAWVHLDIAGTSRTESTKGYNPKGATGVAVRTLARLAQALGS